MLKFDIVVLSSSISSIRTSLAESTVLEDPRSSKTVVESLQTDE